MRDSIRVAGPGLGLDRAQRVTRRAVDRGAGGAVGPRALAGVRPERATWPTGWSTRAPVPGGSRGDALWLTRSGVGVESIVRIGIDPATGRLATRQDTLLSGNFNNFSVTADGSTLVVDDGTQDYSLWAIGWPTR